MKTLALGAIQTACSPDLEANLKKTASRIEEAAHRGAQIICLQEFFRTRYLCQEENPALFGLAETIPGPTTETLSPLARRLGVVIVASIFELESDEVAGGATGGPPSSAWTERSEGSRRMGARSDSLPAKLWQAGTRHNYNTAVAIDADGKVLGKYRKVHVPDDLKNYYGESFYFKPGNLGYPVFKTRFATVGLQVCYDQWFPEGARALAKNGAEIIFYPTSIGWSAHPSPHPSPARGEGDKVRDPLHPVGEGGPELVEGPGEGDEHDAWMTVQRGHAISNGVFVVVANRVGREDHIDFWGTSFICDPMGKILGKASPDKEETLVVECDLSRIEEVRRDWPFLKEC